MKRLLIVEDEHDTRVNLRWALEEEGYKVHSAAHGQAALEFLESQPLPDGILLDLQLPLVTGEELLDALARRERWREIPVIVVTGSSRERRFPRAREVLFKPLEIPRLLKAVRAHIGTERPRHDAELAAPGI